MNREWILTISTKKMKWYEVNFWCSVTCVERSMTFFVTLSCITWTRTVHRDIWTVAAESFLSFAKWLSTVFGTTIRNRSSELCDIKMRPIRSSQCFVSRCQFLQKTFTSNISLHDNIEELRNHISSKHRVTSLQCVDLTLECNTVELGEQKEAEVNSCVIIIDDDE